jgi:hypothetical protein
MSWDSKGPHGAYFYLSVREDGRVRKVYVGRGERAEELARQIQERRREQRAGREAREREEAQVADAEHALRELRDMASLLVQAVLVGEGLHKRRGQWRRRRHASGRRENQEPCTA